MPLEDEILRLKKQLTELQEALVAKQREQFLDLQKQIASFQDQMQALVDDGGAGPAPPVQPFQPAEVQQERVDAAPAFEPFGPVTPVAGEPGYFGPEPLDILTSRPASDAQERRAWTLANLQRQREARERESVDRDRHELAQTMLDWQLLAPAGPDQPQRDKPVVAGVPGADTDGPAIPPPDSQATRVQPTPGNEGAAAREYALAEVKFADAVLADLKSVSAMLIRLSGQVEDLTKTREMYETSYS